MATVFDDLQFVQPVNRTYQQTDELAWLIATCATCHGTQMAVLARSLDQGSGWLRCVSCNAPHVFDSLKISPSVKPLAVPAGLSGVELGAWNEVRECLASGAYTAAVMMCRKILFHIAVANGLSQTDENGRAPSFLSSVNHLESVGIVTLRMRPWVDRIKDVGNEANHVINPIEQHVALDVAVFTEQLLKLTYEMNELMTRNAADLDT